METRLTQVQNYRMHIKKQNKDQTIFIKYNN